MGAETYNVRVLYSRKHKLIYQKWYLKLDTTRCTHAQTTAIGTGAFMVAWTGAAACPGERSRSVTSGPPEAGLVLQIKTLRFSPCTMSRSVTGRAGFAVQMLQIETIEGPGSSNRHKGTCPHCGGRACNDVCPDKTCQNKPVPN